MGYKRQTLGQKEQKAWTKILHSSYKHPSGCWIWLRTTSRGYGITSFLGKSVGAHRLMAYLKIDKSILDNPKLYVCHRCDNTHCINPEHLFIGTPSDNQQDCSRKGRKNTRKPLTWYTKYGV